MAWLEALLGQISDNGNPLEGLGGLNFIGFTITPDGANGRYNIAASGSGGGGGGSTVASGITNDSSVSGSTVKDALNTLLSAANTDATNISTNAAKITALTVAGAGKLPYVSGTPGTYSASVWTTDGTNLSGVGTIGSGAITSTGVGTFVGIVAGGAVSGVTTLAMAGALSGATSIACTSLACAGAITSVTTLNGASVAAPAQGTAVTTTVTLQIGNGSEYDVTAAGGAYAITLGTTGVADGDMFILRATNALANAVTITNGGTGGGNLGPSGVMTSAVKAVYYYYYDGTATAWKYSGRVRCA
jgi:hypothetical protein